MGILTNTAATPEVPEAPVAPTAAELAVLALRQMVINFFYNYNGETFQLSTKLGYQILGDKTARELVKNQQLLQSLMQKSWAELLLKPLPLHQLPIPLIKFIPGCYDWASSWVSSP